MSSNGLDEGDAKVGSPEEDDNGEDGATSPKKPKLSTDKD